MTLGASKAAASTPVDESYGVFITPSQIDVSFLPGSGTTVPAIANVTGGVGPFTYLWTFLSGDGGITINTPTGSQTTFSASGANETSFIATFKVTVTDTGNANVETTATIDVTIVFFAFSGPI